jgi:hypothetical protein
MSQHFLLSARAKTLTLASVVRMSDSEVEQTFIRLRWANNNGEPYCPKCGYVICYASRRKGCVRYQCKACQKDFSLTSGTLFASRKMPLRSYLMAIAIFVNEVKGEVHVGDVPRPGNQLQGELRAGSQTPRSDGLRSHSVGNRRRWQESRNRRRLLRRLCEASQSPREPPRPAATREPFREAAVP